MFTGRCLLGKRQRLSYGLIDWVACAYNLCEGVLFGKGLFVRVYLAGFEWSVGGPSNLKLGELRYEENDFLQSCWEADDGCGENI